MSSSRRSGGKLSRARLTLGALVQPALLTVLLFGPAPTWAWWRAWVLVGVSLTATAMSLVLLQREAPALLAERFRPPMQSGQPAADKAAVLVFIATFIAAVLFIPTDVHFWRILPPPGALVGGIGLGLFLLGWWIVLAALRANAFAVPVVKDQGARYQRVVDSGPYAVVRHPMYAGVALVLVGMPLWLGSSAGALVALAPIAVLAVRTSIEEHFLRSALEGYAPYAERVRARLIPGLW